MIRVDAVWMAVEPLDMRAGTEAALRRVVTVFGRLVQDGQQTIVEAQG